MARYICKYGRNFCGNMSALCPDCDKDAEAARGLCISFEALQERNNGFVSGLARHTKKPITLEDVLPVVLAALAEKYKR